MKLQPIEGDAVTVRPRYDPWHGRLCYVQSVVAPTSGIRGLRVATVYVVTCAGEKPRQFLARELEKLEP